MEVSFEFDNHLLIVKLVGELDEHSAEFVRRKMDAVLEDKNYSAVVLDLSRMNRRCNRKVQIVAKTQQGALRKEPLPDGGQNFQNVRFVRNY